VRALLDAYPEGAAQGNNRGEIALHHACGKKVPDFQRVSEHIFQEDVSEDDTEYGRYIPSTYTLERVCRGYGLTAAYSYVTSTLSEMLEAPDLSEAQKVILRLHLQQMINMQNQLAVQATAAEVIPDDQAEGEEEAYEDQVEEEVQRMAVEVVRTLLDAYPEGPTKQDKNGWLPLHTACFHSAPPEVVRALLDAHPEGAREQNCGLGLSPLHLACDPCEDSVHPEVVRALLDVYPKGATKEDRTGWIPLHLACKSRVPPEVVRALLDAYPEGATKQDSVEIGLNKEQNFPLHTALVHSAPLEVVRALLDAYPEGAAQGNNRGEIALHHACGKKVPDFQRVSEHIFQEDVSEDDTEYGRYIPSTYTLERVCRGYGLTAAYSYVTSTLSEMLEAPDLSEAQKVILRLHLQQMINMQNQLAVQATAAEVIPDDQAEGEEEAYEDQVEEEVQRMAVEVVRTLLDAYPEGPTKQDKNGWLPLHTACFHSAPPEVVRALLDAHPEGAREQNCGLGLSPLHLACDPCEDSVHPEVVRALLDVYPKGATKEDRTGWIPLHLACKSRVPPEVVRALLDAYPEGATQEDSSGSLPLYIACKNEAPLKVVRALLDAYPEGAAK